MAEITEEVREVEDEKKLMNLEVMMRWMVEMKESIEVVLRNQGEMKEEMRGEMKKMMLKLERQELMIGEMGEKVEKLEKENERKEVEMAKLVGRLERMEKVFGEKGEEKGMGKEEGEGSKEAKEGWGRKWEEVVDDKLREREKEARRKSQIRITGLVEKERESVGELRKEVVDIFEKKMKVEGSGAMVMDAYRVGKKGEDRWNRPRVVIVKMGSEFQRNLVLRGKPNLREWRGLGVDMDRTKEEVEARREELRRRREVKAREVPGEVVTVAEEGKGEKANGKEKGQGEGSQGLLNEDEEKEERGSEATKGRRQSGRLLEKGKGKIIKGVEMFEDASEGEEEEEDDGIDESYYVDDDWREVPKDGRKGKGRGRGRGRGRKGTSTR